jgi:hypothetical protein
MLKCFELIRKLNSKNDDDGDSDGGDVMNMISVMLMRHV